MSEDYPAVPVAQQRAAGVPPDQTVTLADQAAGTPPPDQAMAQRDQEVSARDQEVTARNNASQPLSGDERAELDRLRAEAAAAKAPKPPEDAPPENTHVLFLADGSTVEVPGQMTHYKDVPVIGAYPIVQKAE